MAEGQILTQLASKLGVTSDRVIRKANEYMRMADVRSAYSSLSSLNLSGSCKSVMCLELAAVAHGENIDRAAAQRLAGTKNKKLYSSALRSMECLLGLQNTVTVTDLTVQYGCPGAKQLTMQTLKKYEAERLDTDSTEYSQVLFNSAALYAVCRRQKQKIDKQKLILMTGVKRAVFDRVVAHMDKIVEAILKEQREVQTKSKKSSTFMDEIEQAANYYSSTKRSHQLEAQEEEPFEDWKKRILEQAYKALQMEYKPKS